MYKLPVVKKTSLFNFELIFRNWGKSRNCELFVSYSFLTCTVNPCFDTFLSFVSLEKVCFGIALNFYLIFQGFCSILDPTIVLLLFLLSFSWLVLYPCVSDLIDK